MKIRKTHINARIPKKVRSSDTGYDLTAAERIIHSPFKVEYRLGVAMQPNKDVYIEMGGQLRCRSSVHETGLILSNGVGTHDTEYTGELSAIFYINPFISWVPWLRKDKKSGEWKFNWNRLYKVGDRVIQWVPEIPITGLVWDSVTPFEETDRGDKGYGSSGN